VRKISQISKVKQILNGKLLLFNGNVWATSGVIKRRGVGIRI